ncbi:site-2 protease family protein [Desulfuromonas sp. AOP6]|uniref:site-2 protease family protein n=1 Tax=Desulfuromonas sp. AOP6 TaxID=1566351 RepID=UPI00128A43D5|nr:site-2 protease family protein [Desulfuromonas sp. AOP6]BCA80055.1 protease [Desulfuromonas sp. AOP6]
MEQILVKISIMLVPALLAVTVHELSHGFFAEKFGDPTARLLGRLTLNPLKHLDPIGTLALLFFGFGWARPVPVNFNNLKNPKQNMVWVALAGPLSNFALALLSALLLRVMAVIAELKILEGTLLQAAFEPIVLMVSFSLLINVILAIFNLIPVPPLDGGRVLTGILPKKQADMLARLEPFGFVIIIFVIFFTDVWRLFLYPLIWFVVGKLAGPQVGVVEYVMQFLFGN